MQEEPPTDTDTLRREFDFFMNFEGRSSQESDYITKLRDLTRGPNRLYDFFEYLRTFVGRARQEMAVNDCHSLPDILSLTVSKASILRTLNYFDKADCINAKICFGMDACLIPQLIVSGTFFCDGKEPSISLIDAPYRKKRSTGQNRFVETGHYVLNFGRQISVNAARTYLSRFDTAIKLGTTHPELDSDLRGYSLDIKTFRYLLEDVEYLGKAKTICIRMGINNHGYDPSIPRSKRVRIMMLEFSDSNEGVGKSFYMCSRGVKDDNDETECPPRQPCNMEIS